MDTSRDTEPQMDVYSLRERIEEHRSHAPTLCTARFERARASRGTTLCRFGERSSKDPRAGRPAL